MDFFMNYELRMQSVELFKSNVQMFKCSNVQMFKCSNVQILLLKQN